MKKTKQIYLLFSDTGSLLTKAINVYTKSTLNHTSIAFDRELTEVYSFGRKRPRNPFIGGFVKEDMGTDFFQNAQCAVYSITVTEQEYEQLRLAIKQMEAHKHEYKYNFIGLFAVAINKEWQRENAYFCSQFVAKLLSESGIYQMNKPHCLVRPEDLRKLHQMQLVYQGALGNYPYFKSNENSNHIIHEFYSSKLGV